MSERLQRFCSLCLVVALCLLFTSCHQGTQPAQPHLKHVKLLIDWKAEPTYAGFYLARELGFYKRRGVDVEIAEGSGATVSAQVIGAGDQYLIGSCSGEATAIARSRGIPIRSVAVLYPNVPTVIYSRQDTPIQKPTDLIGKRIGLIDGSISVDEYKGLLAANHIDRAVLRFADFGLKAYSLNLIANDRALATEDTTIRAVVDGTVEGYEFLRQNPSEAAKIFGHLFPERNPEYVRDSTQVVSKLLGDSKIGAQTQEGWEATISTLKLLGLLDKTVTVSEVTAKEYLTH